MSTKTMPNALGYYYYKDTVSDYEAFETLKECMLQEHIDRIYRLQASKEALRRYSFDKNSKTSET